jgi:hypothetical protein
MEPVVVTYATHSAGYFVGLQQSCAKQGFTLQVLGQTAPMWDVHLHRGVTGHAVAGVHAKNEGRARLAGHRSGVVFTVL